MLTIGIDPGLTGGIAAIDPDGALDLCTDLPVMRIGKLAWIDGGELQSLLINTTRGRPARAIVERAQAMPKMAVSAVFNYGVGFGSVLSILQALRIGINFASPGKWKGEMGLTREKAISVNKARLLYPDAELTLVKHHGRAEALLLAHWDKYKRTN